MTTLGYIFFLVKFFGGLILLFALGYKVNSRDSFVEARANTALRFRIPNWTPNKD